jgi:hypothetical protein
VGDSTGDATAVRFLENLVEGLFDRGGDKILFGGEVFGEKSVGETNFLGNSLQADAVDAVFAEQACRCGDGFLAVLLRYCT